MAALTAIMDALASQLNTQLGTAIMDLQVEPRMVWNPLPRLSTCTPPARSKRKSLWAK